MNHLELMLHLAQQGILTVLLVAGIPTAVALVLGLVTSLLQAVTQLHEPSLGFSVKLLALSLGLLACSRWTVELVTRFGLLCLSHIREL
ncbi:MAG: flagellar biosynthetic protein FliQ [Myxococcota bacterium]